MYLVFNSLGVDKFHTFLVAGHTDLLFDIQLAMVKGGLIGGDVYVAEDSSGSIVGSAIWFGPNQELFHTAEEREAGFTKFMAKLTEKELNMTSWWMEYFLPAYAEFTARMFGSLEYKLKAWHLQLIGVLPAHQHRGIGRALIKHSEEVIANSPSEGPKHLCLETETESAERLGYVNRGVMELRSEEKMNQTVPMFCCAKEIA
ncbi:hypothetical protein SCHPADRAFT_825154 [Schizopora paradoxa]|uniref:N-acetyltransferase domain-containing protein n=1 Tax=Schizopora paradoxa TaxID=27342 RepID=A0A0H2SDR6_9AGAM|nr:hypothetical protein SCHPADRAFT_825154 [Schizopora paradoxa]